MAKLPFRSLSTLVKEKIKPVGSDHNGCNCVHVPPVAGRQSRQTEPLATKESKGSLRALLLLLRKLLPRLRHHTETDQPPTVQRAQCLVPRWRAAVQTWTFPTSTFDRSGCKRVGCRLECLLLPQHHVHAQVYALQQCGVQVKEQTC